ncbi:hypothetical protein J4N42_19415 [Vibrio sp. SCSIO 43135]|uniref:Uncharacterized protein n=1 Tax=Vibrio paucivorans TaxID=2829489 RepID=A0A9X3CHX7_9VIBR|nr:MULTISPECIES: hypothetical protein [Vibrio]MCW8336167.1 hypothetical protein [Vibrio paucivorans]USD42789.1 hypothetical protein J4N42_19415 [Vibrio sp. SCSIO 43135]
MDKLLSSALEIRQRTQITTLFASKGYKIAMTDFDEVVFEKAGVQVNVHFDRASNAQSISVLDGIAKQSFK